MVDYRKFDSIDVSDDEEEMQVSPNAASGAAPPAPKMKTKKSKDGRYIFEHEGRTIYEWEQSIDECNIYIHPPEGVTRAHLDIVITNESLRVGLKEQTPFINEKTGGSVKVSESFWTLADGELNINLQKLKKGEMWESALGGASSSHSVDSFTKEEERKKLMLERFQEEHPGFDFSGAEFNGNVPDAQHFMGGIKY